jgi:hypothetical protein
MNFDQAVFAEMRAFPGLGSVTIRPVVAQQSDKAPYVVYKKLATRPNWTLTGPSTLDRALYQVDVYSRDFDEARTLADLVIQALTKSPLLTGVPQSDGSDYEPDTKLHRRMMEFSVWLNG